MTINEGIIERLREYQIPARDGIPFLLGLYYGHESTFFTDLFKKRMMATKIYEADKKASNTIVWNIPLFEDQVTGFEWVVDWMGLFENFNRDRKGVKSHVMSRMKKFFVEHPAIRKDDVIEATKMYIRSVENPKYLKTSHKFIMEGRGADRYSLLHEWVEKRQNWEESMKRRNSPTNTIQ